MILLVLTVPHEDTQVLDFMSAPENCGGFCLLGIQPGKSRVGAARQTLESHSWVNDVRLDAAGNGYATMSWGWNGHQPAAIDPNKRGRITFFWVDEDVIPLEDAAVETVTVYTTLHHYSLYKWLGKTGGGTASFRPDGKLGYSLIYDIQGGILNLYIETSCPFDLIHYWNTQTRITLSVGHSNTGFIPPTQLARFCKFSRS